MPNNPLPGVVTVRVPLGFYTEPAPPELPLVRSIHVPDWLPVSGIDVELARRDTRLIGRLLAKTLDAIPPLFPLP